MEIQRQNKTTERYTLLTSAGRYLHDRAKHVNTVCHLSQALLDIHAGIVSILHVTGERLATTTMKRLLSNKHPKLIRGPE